MKYLIPKSHIKSKVRGLKRKTALMLRNIEEKTLIFPEEEIPNCGYWHYHLPVAQSFIDSKNTPKSIRKLCIQTLVNRAEYLKSIKPKSKINIRIVVCISLPNLWDSQLIIFYGEKYFSKFFKRNSPEQTWTKINKSTSLIKYLNIKVQSDTDEKGYLQEIKEEDLDIVNELWFLGELS